MADVGGTLVVFYLGGGGGGFGAPFFGALFLLLCGGDVVVVVVVLLAVMVLLTLLQLLFCCFADVHYTLGARRHLVVDGGTIAYQWPRTRRILREPRGIYSQSRLRPFFLFLLCKFASFFFFVVLYALSLQFFKFN